MPDLRLVGSSHEGDVTACVPSQEAWEKQCYHRLAFQASNGITTNPTQCKELKSDLVFEPRQLNELSVVLATSQVRRLLVTSSQVLGVCIC